jgi:hypothetical protein
MGLTIQYSLHSGSRSIDEARRLVGALRHRALGLSFQQVSEILDLSGDACDYEKQDRDRPHRWLLIQANQPIERDDYTYNVAPTRLIAFSTLPGEGSEPANFGLCRYPRTIAGYPRHGVKQVRTGLPLGWFWRSFCKTQYASNPQTGDVENFLRCHLSVIRLLDEAEKLGMLQTVFDEGGYWTKRDVEALVKEVGEWNAMVAGFVGGMKDLIGGIAAEITKFPNFEHLEAKGQGQKDGNDTD